MIKRISLFLCLALILLLIPACNAPFEDDGRIKVVATIFPQYDFTREIAGNLVELRMLLPPASESHSFEPTPNDIKMISECDVFIYTGGESDTWLDSILASIDTSDKIIISLMDVAELREEEEIGEHNHCKEESEEEEVEYDEHVWTSPKNAVLISQAICDALCKKDSDNSASYRESCAGYIKKLDALDESFREIASNAKNKVLIFGDRFPLLYFVREYGFEYRAAFSGCSAATEPSAKTVASLIDDVRENNIPVVFQIELSNGLIARTISEETGVTVRTFYTCHNVSRADYENGESYLSLMERNLITLKEALG